MLNDHTDALEREAFEIDALLGSGTDSTVYQRLLHVAGQLAAMGRAETADFAMGMARDAANLAPRLADALYSHWTGQLEDIVAGYREIAA